jgi:transposase InsO family protein
MPHFRGSVRGSTQHYCDARPALVALSLQVKCCDGALLLFVEDRAGCLQDVPDSDEADAAVFDYLERVYNAKRRHSIIGYLSPVVFEERTALA